MSYARRFLTLAAVLVLAGCAGTKPKPCPPPELEVVEVPVTRYPEVGPELRALLAPCPIATGALRDAPHVARLRREALEACNGDKAAVLEMLERAEAENRR